MLNPPSCINTCEFLKDAKDNISMYKNMIKLLGEEKNNLLREIIALKLSAPSKETIMGSVTEIGKNGKCIVCKTCGKPKTVRFYCGTRGCPEYI
jgi:hypothetical protein